MLHLLIWWCFSLQKPGSTALLFLSNKALWAKQSLFVFLVFFLLNSLPVNTTFGHWFEHWGKRNDQTLSQALSSICSRLEASRIPLLPSASAFLIVPVPGCGFTPAPPVGTGQHSWGHLHCSTHLTFLASQLPAPLCFTCSFFPAALCLLIVFPCHTGLLQAFPQWQSRGAAALVGLTCSCCPWGGTPLLGWDVPHPKSMLVSPVPVAAASGIQTDSWAEHQHPAQEMSVWDATG